MKQTLKLLCIGFSLVLAMSQATVYAADPMLVTELVFPLNPKHNHAPGIVECPNGDLFATWYRGAGERQADDVAVFAAWKKRGSTEWVTRVRAGRYAWLSRLQYRAVHRSGQTAVVVLPDDFGEQLGILFNQFQSF